MTRPDMSIKVERKLHDMRIAGIIFRIDAEKIKRRTSVSEENKVIDEVNTSGVVEQPVGVEEIPPVKTEAIPPVNTEPTHPVQPPVEPAQKLEDYYKETAEDRAAEEEYEQVVKDPQNRKEKIDQIKSIFHRSGEKKFSREEVILSKIRPEDMLEYLTLEQRRLECLQKARQSRNEKLLKVLQLAAILAAIVSVVALLKDNPVVLVNILYMLGIVAAIWIWKNPGKK